MTTESTIPSLRCHRRTMSPVRPGRAVLRLVIALAVIAALSVAAIAYFNRSDSGKGEESALYTVRSMDFDITLTATGELRASRETVLRSNLETTVPIVEIVDEGITVDAGDLLVRLSDDEIRQRLENETLTLETARSELVSAENALEIQRSDNESNLRAANLELELAQLALQQWRDGDHPKELERLQADLDSARRNFERLSDKFEQSKELFEKNFKSKNDYDQEQIQLLEAESRVKQAELGLATYRDYQRPRDEKQRTSDVAEAEAKVDRVTKQNAIELASREANRKNARRQLELREERLAKLREQLGYTVVRAPNDGLVVYNSSTRNGRWNDDPPEPGKEISPNQVVIVLPDTTEMVAAVRVHESLAGRLRPGQTAMVQIEALGSRIIPGTVDSIGVLAESGSWRDPNLREYTVRILLQPGEWAKELKPSMRAEATIVLDQVDDALTIPVQSVFSEGRLRYVYQPNGTRFARTPIRLGRRSETEAEVLAGLSAGDRVLVRTPQPGEVVGQPWDQARLETVGFTLDEQGQPIPAQAETARPRRTADAPSAQAQPEKPVATEDKAEELAAAPASESTGEPTETEATEAVTTAADESASSNKAQPAG